MCLVFWVCASLLKILHLCTGKNCGFDLSKSLSIHEHKLYVVINFFQLFLPFSFNRNLQTFEESFSYACPKFISPVPPNFDAPPANFNRVGHFSNLQMVLLNFAV